MAESRAGGLLVDCPRQLIRQSAKANDHSRAAVKHGTCRVEGSGRQVGGPISGLRVGSGQRAAVGRRSQTDKQPVLLQFACEVKVARILEVRRVVVAAAQPVLRKCPP